MAEAEQKGGLWQSIKSVFSKGTKTNEGQASQDVKDEAQPMAQSSSEAKDPTVEPPP